MWNLPLLFLLAGILCALLTPLVSSLAIRWGQVDKPDGLRKIHAKPIPLAGGAAVLFSSILALLAAPLVGCSLGVEDEGNIKFIVGLAIASVFICLLGIVDDRVLLRGRYKLAGQVIAVGILVSAGVVVRSISLFGAHLELGTLAIPLTGLWMLGAINSLNLIDGMDGLLSSLGCIICLSLAFMAIFSGHTSSALIAITLAGALAGFLCFNFPPASVFLGDSGSMLIGLVIGVLSIHGSMKRPAAIALSVPLALLTIPLFDTVAAIARRKLTGKSLYFADREHLHHCLLRRGFSNRRALYFVSGLCLLTGAGAMAALVVQNEAFAVLAIALVITVLIATRSFGYSELVLIKKHLANAASLWFSRGVNRDHHAMEVQFHGSVDWQELRSKLAFAGAENDLISLVIDISASAGKERYHARWSKAGAKEESIGQWQAIVPLSLGPDVAGQLRVAGEGNGGPISKQLVLLADLVDDLESELSDCLPAEEPEDEPLTSPVGLPAVSSRSGLESHV